MMELRCVKADACGNTTAFVMDPVARQRYGEVSRAAMSPRCLGAEQAGFIFTDEATGLPRMEMMGGEFCGNASRSFAALLTMPDIFPGPGPGPGPGQTVPLIDDGVTLDISVSGHEGLLSSTVSPLGAPNMRLVYCDMPLPTRVRFTSDAYFGDCAIVSFEGITHIILNSHAPLDGDVENARRMLLGSGEPGTAFGLMYRLGREHEITPLVHIGEAGTTVWETSCGSGSCAFASAMASSAGEGCHSEYEIKQPGGTLNVSVEQSCGRLTRIRLGGPVSITVTGTVYLDGLD